jgi:hypothetical protein
MLIYCYFVALINKDFEVYEIFRFSEIF